MPSVQKIIELLNLKPHPEGGYYRETYRSEGIIKEECLGSEYTGNRNFSTSIYYLLDGVAFSAFHRIVQDETWHFYDGAPVELQMITELGYHIEVIMGRDLEKGQVLQFTVPGGTWFGAKTTDAQSYSLFGCTVAPGFTFADFTMGQKSELLKLFPQHADLIKQYTR